MKTFRIFILVLALVTTISCSKESNLTSADLIAKELKEVIEKNNIQRVINFKLDQSWGNTWILGNYGKNYKFQGQFIQLEGEWYNLNRLIRYQIEEKYDNDYKVAVKFLLLSFY